MIADELCSVPMLCARAALEFFSSGTGFAPMGKVSNPAPDLLHRVRNVAWDYLQVEWRQEFAGNHGRNGCFHIPYFLTFDRGLAQLHDLSPQRSCLFGDDLQFPIFFQDFDFASLVLGRYPELGTLLGRVFSVEAHEQRNYRLRERPPHLPTIIQQLEQQLSRFQHN